MWIFLDIDGVLVPEKKFDHPIEESEILSFDRTCLHNFENVLREHPDVFVVISSSWRELFSLDTILPLFSPDVAKRIVGFTPFLDPKHLHQFQYIRYQEVLDFLQQHNALRDRWVAVDDIPEHYPPDAPVVVTDANSGFDESAAIALELYLLSEKCQPPNTYP